MDDKPCTQAKARREFRLSDRTTPKAAARVEKLRSSGTVDRAVDAATAQQRAVRGVDDRVYVQGRDIGVDYTQHSGHENNSSEPGASGLAGRTVIRAVNDNPAGRTSGPRNDGENRKGDGARRQAGGHNVGAVPRRCHVCKNAPSAPTGSDARQTPMTTNTAYGDIPLPAGIRSRFVENNNGLIMHVLEAGY
jgi:hypothetical protein